MAEEAGHLIRLLARHDEKRCHRQMLRNLFNTPHSGALAAAKPTWSLEGVLRKGDVVVEVGAPNARWARKVLETNEVRLTSYVQTPAQVEAIRRALPDTVAVHHAILSNHDDPLTPSQPRHAQTPRMRLDTACDGANRHIRLAKLHRWTDVYAMLQGATSLLRKGRIDVLEFEKTKPADAEQADIHVICALLARHGYRVHEAKQPLVQGSTADATHPPATLYTAVSARLTSLFSDRAAALRTLPETLTRFDVEVHKALIVGAVTEAARAMIKDSSCTELWFVNSGPSTPPDLGAPEVRVIPSDPADLASQARIGAQLAKHDLPSEDIDLLCFGADQGTALLTGGAEDLLPSVQALCVDIGFPEANSCVAVGDVDTYLSDHNLIRVATLSLNDDDRATALYVRRPIVTSSSVGTVGRFANHLFQYVFLQCYASDHDFTPVTGRWAGDDIFHVTPGVDVLPTTRHTQDETGQTLPHSKITTDAHTRPNTDFTGFFQYHTSYYRPYCRQIREHLSFKEGYAVRATEISTLFAAQPGPVACIHLRRGDFGTGIFFMAPETWYADWLSELRRSHPDLAVYLASDDLEAVLPAFTGFKVLCARDLPTSSLSHGFFTDFAALTLGDHLAISNSSFSFSASMLNTKAQTYVRPSLSAGGLVSYDPWNAPVLLRDTKAEDAGETFMSERAKGRSKYRLRKLKRRLMRQ